MKNIILLIITSIIFASCWTDFGSGYSVEYDLIIKNKSGVDLKILAFRKKIQLDDINIQNDGTFLKTIKQLPKQIHPNSGMFSNDSSNTNGYRDSIVIIFNNSKIINQYCNGRLVGECSEIPKNLDIIADPNNSLNKRFGKGLISHVSKSGPYQIIFTKEDYDRAVPIK